MAEGWLAFCLLSLQPLQSARMAVERLRRFRLGKTLNGLSLIDLRDAGRRA